jgi:hypothetical protein
MMFARDEIFSKNIAVKRVVFCKKGGITYKTQSNKF